MEWVLINPTNYGMGDNQSHNLEPW